MCGEELAEQNLRRRTENRRPDGLAVFVFLGVPDAWNKKHHELIENRRADQRRKSKSSPLQQQWYMVVQLH
jgi:hypothetical protein